MEIDNSAASAFERCPAYYQEKYLVPNAAGGLGIEPLDTTWANYGKRMHELLAAWYTGTTPPECNSLEIEIEAQTMLEAYKSTYPIEPFEVIAIEQTYRVPLNERHIYVFKTDGIVVDKTTRLLQILEHKSEKRNSYRNHPMAWASRRQVSLYLWGARQIFGEPFKNILLNVLTRQSPKGQYGPTFTRQELERTEQQQTEAVRDLIWVADKIEDTHAQFGEEPWPKNREQCRVGNFNCDFYDLHLYGRSEELIQIKYKPAEPYLDM